MSVKAWAIGISIVVVLAIMIGLLVGSVRDLDPNEVAFDYDHNVGLIVDDTVLYEGGRHFLGLGHDFIVYPRTVQTLSVTNEDVRSSDGLQIDMDVTVQYVFAPLNAQTLKNIYYSFQEDYTTAFTYIVEASLRDISSQYYASDFYERRVDLQQDMLNDLKAVFLNLSVSVDDLQLVNVALPPALSNEIQNTELAKQDSQSALNERNVQLLQLDTRTQQATYNIEILYFNRDNQVNLTLTSALSQQDTLLSIYVAEATALSAVINALNLTDNQLEAYMYLKALQNTGANVHLSIGQNQQLVP